VFESTRGAHLDCQTVHLTEPHVVQVITLLANITAFGPNPLMWSSAALASAMLLHITAILNDIVLVRPPPSPCVSSRPASITSSDWHSTGRCVVVCPAAPTSASVG
jgi:hypothetical protein